MQRQLNWMLWMVTGCLLVTLIANVPSTLAQSQSVQPVQVAQASDRDQIAQITIQQLTRDGGTAQARVTRIKVVGNYALAHWVRGEAGGQSLLGRNGDSWGVLGSGGGAMDVATLRSYGVPTDAIARQLLAR